MPAREHLLKIGVSGIRGVVGEFLTPALACAFAQAFGTYVGGGRVVVGRDTRSSGPMLQHAVPCGLLAAGCEVVDVGVLPTPTIQIYVAATGAPRRHRAHRVAQSARVQRAQAVQRAGPVLQQLRAQRTDRPLPPERISAAPPTTRCGRVPRTTARARNAHRARAPARRRRSGSARGASASRSTA